MMLYHFVLALLLAVVIMPKSPSSLNELNKKIVKKYEKQPSYIVKMDDQLFKLDDDKKRLINARWIDDLEVVEPASLPAGFAEEEDLVFLVKLKERKEDNFRVALQVRSIELQALEAYNTTD